MSSLMMIRMQSPDDSDILRSMKRLIIFLLFQAALPVVAKSPEQVAILLQEKARKSLAEPLAIYVADVEERFEVKLVVLAKEWKTPEQVRTAIKDLHEKQSITGAILVGAMPMHRFYMHGFANPNPLFYEDFDLPFKDRDNDGFADVYQGTPNPKIWVANLRSSVKADDDDTDGLRRFLAKTHAHYHASEPVLPAALAVSAEDWPTGGTSFKQLVAGKLFPKDSVAVIENKACTFDAVTKAFEGGDRTLTHLQAHSDWNSQQLDGGDLTAKAVAKWKTGSLITINHGCSAGNWMHNEAEQTSPNMAMSYVFGNNIGQVTVAQVRSGMIYQHETIYEYLSEGEYVGKAYLKAKQKAELQFTQGDHAPGDVISGILMIGNPFIKLDISRNGENR